MGQNLFCSPRRTFSWSPTFPLDVTLMTVFNAACCRLERSHTSITSVIASLQSAPGRGHLH